MKIQNVFSFFVFSLIAILSILSIMVNAIVSLLGLHVEVPGRELAETRQS
jgi:hypothetical protein